MNDEEQGPQDMQSGSMTLGDIYHVLFRRKWIIILFCAMAVLGAVAVCIIKPPRYHTEAQLFIRYVVEGRPVNPPGDDADARPLSSNSQGGGILDTEAQMIRSLDVAQQVVDTIGPQKLLAKVGGGTNRDRAAVVVSDYLKVQLPVSGSVITITYEHPDPEVAQQVLQQVIAAYINKHKEMHRPVEIFGDFLTQETARLRSQLTDTEQRLKEAKSKAGVVSLEDSKVACAEGKRKVRAELWSAQAELADHEAALQEVTNLMSAVTQITNAEPQMSLKQIADYRNVCARLEVYSRREQELLSQFTGESTPIRDIRRQVAEAQQLKNKLEQEYPRLATLVLPAQTAAAERAGTSIDPATEMVQIRGVKSKIELLNSQLAQYESEQAKVVEMEDTIQELQRKKELLEADLKYFSGSLEHSRVEQALGAGKAPNIGIIQSPSPPLKTWSQPFKKKMAMLTAACVMSGFALAFLIELFLDRSVKRPVDVTGKLRLPLFISIPDFTRNGGRRLRQPSQGGGDDSSGLDGEPTGERSSSTALMRPLAVWDHDHPLRRFYEGLRDRLIVHFEVKNLTHKPKLVAVTSCGKGVGVSSIAAGLAASLSETGDGNVLLVDMNAEQGASQAFYKGQPGCVIEDPLVSETRQDAMVQSNLYVVTERLEDNQIPSILPKRFRNLMPKLKASHYDYIIFDMPPVSQTSITPRLARLMDMLLLVIESEKTSQDVAKQAISLLAESKVNVSAVLNKTRNYVPARLHQEFPDDI